MARNWLLFLPTLIPRTAKDELRINVALSLLSCLLEELRSEMERGKEGAAERMGHLQAALARHVFVAESDPDLCSAVGRTSWRAGWKSRR